MNRRTFIRNAVLGWGGSLLPACPPSISRLHILGSGITGICAGALLSKAGYSVHVLESNPDVLGGHTAGFEQEGFRFCFGPQYVWHFRNEAIGVRVIEHLTLSSRVPFDSMDPEGFEEYRVGEGDSIPIPMGLDGFFDAAASTFPEDHAGLDLFFSYLRDLNEGAEVIDRLVLYGRGAAAMALGLLLGVDTPDRVKARFAQCMRWSLSELFDYCGLSHGARRFLYANSGLFAENESHVSCIAYAAATGFYHAGADYPRFGFQSLVDGLLDSIREAGGTVATGKRVSRLDRCGGRIFRIHCADGDSFETDHIVSTLSPRLTCALLSPPALWQASYAPSNSAVSAFMGVRDYPRLSERLGRKILWWQDGLAEVEFAAPDMDQAPRLLALASPSSNGIFNANARPNDHSLIVFAPGNFNQASQSYSRSPQAHDALRSEIAERMLDGIEAHFLPGLRSHIQFLEVQTPFDLFQRTQGESGNIYGRRLTPASLLTRPYALLGIRNLHIACASTGMPGIASAFQMAALIYKQFTGNTL